MKERAPAEEKSPLELTSAKESAELSQTLKLLRSEVDEMRQTVERLDAEFDIIREQNRLMLRQTRLSLRNRFYLRLGAEIIIPRPRSFEFATDTGIGAMVGVGRYLGKQHVVELSLEWDFFPAATLRYRYEFHTSLPSFTWGPVLGIKSKLFHEKPLDNFLEDPASVKSTFWCIGLMTGFPIARSIFSIEALYLSNQQSAFLTNLTFLFLW